MFSPDRYESYVVDGDGLPIDLIVWRRYRRKTVGMVEAVLDLNPGLADLGPLLPRGTVINIPIDQPATPRQTQLIRLW